MSFALRYGQRFGARTVADLINQSSQLGGAAARTADEALDDEVSRGRGRGHEHSAAAAAAGPGGLQLGTARRAGRVRASGAVGQVVDAAPATSVGLDAAPAGKRQRRPPLRKRPSKAKPIRDNYPAGAAGERAYAGAHALWLKRREANRISVQKSRAKKQDRLSAEAAQLAAAEAETVRLRAAIEEVSAVLARLDAADGGPDGGVGSGLDLGCGAGESAYAGLAGLDAGVGAVADALLIADGLDVGAWGEECWEDSGADAFGPLEEYMDASTDPLLCYDGSGTRDADLSAFDVMTGAM